MYGCGHFIFQLFRNVNRNVRLAYLVVMFFVVYAFYENTSKEWCTGGMTQESYIDYEDPSSFVCFDNENGTPSGRYIVPNIVHFIKWGSQLSFIETVCILAAYKNQKPDKLYIHTDMWVLGGKYWEVLMNEPGLSDVLVVKYLEVPTSIFDQDLNQDWRFWHGGDIGRMKVLLEYGGIFLDGDSFIVRSLDDFRKYEMTIGWQEGLYLANQAVIAHKNARFLRKWLNSYRHHYWSTAWYYNAGERPTSILIEQPHLIHRVKRLFCEYTDIPEFLYLENNSNWSDHYVIHLLTRHTRTLERNLSAEATYPVVFNESNILKYPATILQMVKSVYPL